LGGGRLVLRAWPMGLRGFFGVFDGFLFDQKTIERRGNPLHGSVGKDIGRSDRPMGTIRMESSSATLIICFCRKQHLEL